MTTVSIVMPAYNAAPYIAEAISSALAQTLSDIELLVIDDASTDETPMIAAEFAAADPRVRVLRQKRNSGPSACRNRGMATAQGRWLAILDADDTLAPDRLARLVELGERHNLDMVADNLLLVPEDRPDQAQVMIPPALLDVPRPLGLREFIARNVADRRYPSCNFGFLKPVFLTAFLRDAGIGYDERVRFAEDFTLYVACLSHGADWWLTPEPGYRYRVRCNSLTQVQTVHDLARLREVQESLLRAAGDDRKLARLVRRHKTVVDRCYYYRAFTDAVKARHFREAGRTFLETRTSAPLILWESMRQIPVITTKALRGGYRRQPNLPERG